MELHEQTNVSLYLSDLTLLEDVNSAVQSIQLYQHPQLGIVLVINGEIQNIEKWAPLYHESIVHIPMMFLEEPKSVLLVGGGDLFAAEIVLKYPTVTELILCDHDPEVIRLTAKYYPHAAAVLCDSRLRLVYMDAREYIMESQKQFDLVIDDCFNLVSDFSVKDNIFESLYQKLTPKTGICCSLMYRHIFDSITLSLTDSRLFKRYDTVLSLVTVPEYPGILHLLTMWGKSRYLSQNLSKSVNKWQIACREQCLNLGQLFDPAYCRYYLYIPNYIKQILETIAEKRDA